MRTYTSRYAIGIDLGGTKIEIGIIDDDGKILAHDRLKTSEEGGSQSIEKQIVECIDGLRKQTKVPIIGVGIGVAGQVDPTTGVVIFAPNLNWHHVPLQANMNKALKLPVRVFNDVRAITWGEWKYGAGIGCQDLLCVFIGTGIGSGVVSGGQFLKGHSNTFGEIGHMSIDYNGPLCTCGKKGCLEVFGGGWGIAKKAQEAIKLDVKGQSSQLLLELAHHRLEDVSAKIVIEAYKKKDPLATNLITDVEQALIAGIANLINAYNPQCLILGGGLIDGLPRLIKVIDIGIRHSALKAATHSLEVVPAKLGKQVGVIGSAAAIFHLETSTMSMSPSTV